MGTKHASEKNKCVNSEMKKELKYLRQMKMKTQLYNLLDSAKLVQRENFIAIQTFKKKKKKQVNLPIKRISKRKTAQHEQRNETKIREKIKDQRNHAVF